MEHLNNRRYNINIAEAPLWLRGGGVWYLLINNAGNFFGREENKGLASDVFTAYLAVAVNAHMAMVA